MFGKHDIIEHNSFFNIIFNMVYECLSEEMQYENILIDIFKISNEKYILDQVNIINIQNNLKLIFLEKYSSRCEKRFSGSNKPNSQGKHKIKP